MKRAFEARLRLGHTGDFYPDRLGGVQAGSRQLALAGGEVRRRDIHGRQQVFGDEVDDKLAGGRDVPRRILLCSSNSAGDAHDDVEGIAADGVEEAERGEVDDPFGVAS